MKLNADLLPIERASIQELLNIAQGRGIKKLKGDPDPATLRLYLIKEMNALGFNVFYRERTEVKQKAEKAKLTIIQDGNHRAIGKAQS